MTSEVSRRAVLAGLCGALALAFAPLDRFLEGLGAMFGRIFGERIPARELTWTSAQITIDGQTFDWKPATWFFDPSGRKNGSDSNDGRTAETPLRTWGELNRRWAGA